MTRFRQLMAVVLLAGAAAGLLLFAIQHVALVPLIERAETYEAAAPHAPHGDHADHAHHGAAWEPADGAERTAFTALANVLTGIAFSALLLGAVSLAGGRVDTARGALWGLAGFASFALAPALSLPPVPPATAVADLAARQLWWLATAAATAGGLWLLLGPARTWPLRAAGATLLVLPHLVGAPATDEAGLAPAELVRRFALVSLAASALFWVVLGALGGFLYRRIVPPAEG